MELERLFISRYHDGTLRGSVSFKNDLGEISLNLDAAAGAAVMNVCADALLRVSKKAADEMTAKVIDVMTQSRLTPAPQDEADAG